MKKMLVAEEYKNIKVIFRIKKKCIKQCANGKGYMIIYNLSILKYDNNIVIQSCKNISDCLKIVVQTV